MADETPVELARRLDEATKKAEALKKANQENTDEYRNQLSIINDITERQRQSSDYLQQQIDVLKQQQKIVESMGDSASKTLEIEKTKLDIRELQAEQIRKEILERNKGKDIVGKELDLYKEQLSKLQEITEEKKNMARAEGAAESLLGFLGISEGNKNTLTYQILKNPEGVFNNVASKASNMGGLASSFGVGLSMLMKVQEATVKAFYEQDKAVSSFVAATGASAEYNSIIYQTARGNTALGISFEEAGRAVTDLYTNLNTFTTLSKSAQAELTITTAKLEKLGISGGDTARSIMTLSEMMQISETQAADVVEEFAAMGQAIGVSSKQMISDFVGVKDQLAVFGSEMNKVFTDLEAQSKATGVAVNDLLNLTNKFDTFGSAANQVGKLNAILGGPYLSTMAMIEETDPTERINMLRQAVDNAGMSFTELGYYEKKAIMEAGGFKSVEEAQRVLSMSSGDYAKQLENQRASQEELNNAIERAQPIQDKLTKAMANFAIVLGPIVDLVSALATALVYALDNPIARFIVTMGTITYTVFKVAQAIQAVRGATIALNMAFVTSPAGLVLLALSAIVGGLYYLFMQKRSSPTLYEFFSMLPKMFGLMATSALIFGSSLMQISATLPLLSLGLLGLSIALSSFANPLVLVGIYALGQALSTIVDQINEVETEKIVNFRVMMEKIVEISQPDNMTGFQTFKDNFEAVAKATAEFEIKKAQSFTNLLTATQNLSSNLQLKQDIKVMVDSQQIAARIEKKQGNAAIQGT
jgi:hypothetical protein